VLLQPGRVPVKLFPDKFLVTTHGSVVVSMWDMILNKRKVGVEFLTIFRALGD
jgi:hypothetical protein